MLYAHTASKARVLLRPLPFAADGILRLPLHRLGQIPRSLCLLHHPPDGTWVHHHPAAACVAASALRARSASRSFGAYSCAPDLLRLGVDPTGPPVRHRLHSLRFSPSVSAASCGCGPQLCASLPAALPASLPPVTLDQQFAASSRRTTPPVAPAPCQLATHPVITVTLPLRAGRRRAGRFVRFWKEQLDVFPKISHFEKKWSCPH